ncbi:SU10 major capsid protein [Glutamicibacter sp. AOP5-A2-7]
MAGITGLGTTYNLPNYVGELFAASPEDTPLLSAIGGLTGGESVGATLFEWQGYDLRDADDARQRLEGADAGAGEERVRYNASNVLEIHQEAVAVSYTKQGATKQRATAAMPNVTVGNTVIPADELAWQLEQQFKQIARDIEKTFITGTYQNPTDNTAPRKTRGLLAATTTNVGVAEYALAGDPASVLKDALDDLMQDVWENGGIQEGETRTLVTNARLKRALTTAYITNAGYKEETRNVGGVNLQTIETDFGRFNIMLNRYMPADKLAIASLEDLRPSFLEIPGKGHFFAEPLAKTGASDKVQIYGEIGLNYGNEKKHGVLTVTEAAA